MVENVFFFDSASAQQDIGLRLAASMPAGAIQIHMQSALLAPVETYTAWANFSDGSRDPIRLGGRFNSDLVRSLRKVMCEPEAGTWYSAIFAANPDGSLTSSFNCDEEPDWDAPVDPIAYVTDQEKFPRDEANQPDWLKQCLAEGRESLAERGD